MFESKTQIINFLIEKYSYHSYLEIGVQNALGEFNKVTAKHKVGVDPEPFASATHVMTSDNFFADNKEFFDIILIDGLHEAETVQRDIENALMYLSDNGTIVIHDCKPTSEIMQAVPRNAIQWTGDTWKAFVRTRNNHIDLNMFVLDCDFGVGIIRRSDIPKVWETTEELTYENLVANMLDWLNLMKPDQLPAKLEMLERE